MSETPPDSKQKRVCEHMESCAMYEIFSLSGTLSIWQTRYCQDEFERCERYIRSSRQEPVPVNLMPNGRLLKK
jgi:hypothetical protein